MDGEEEARDDEEEDLPPAEGPELPPAASDQRKEDEAANEVSVEGDGQRRSSAEEARYAAE
jgi:hypothetical protein